MRHNQARFAEHFSEPIKRARAMNATAADRRLGDKRLKELNALRSKNMIRRTKVPPPPTPLQLLWKPFGDPLHSLKIILDLHEGGYLVPERLLYS